MMRSVRWLRGLWILLALLLPAAAPGEVVRLKDQTTVRGRLVQVAGDTLVFRSAFGTLRFHRDQVVSIVFADSAQTAIFPPVPGASAVPAQPAGMGRIEVVFKDRDLSSKIAIELKKNWDARVASNHIVVELLLDGRAVYTAVDTTMDKDIRQGHTTVMKNQIELADFGVDVPSGLHHAKLVVRNADVVTFRKDFDPEPLDLVLTFDNVEIRPGEIFRADVRISKGKLKMGRPRLVKL
jgi:hypothetical protein